MYFEDDDSTTFSRMRISSEPRYRGMFMHFLGEYNPATVVFRRSIESYMKSVGEISSKVTESDPSIRSLRSFEFVIAKDLNLAPGEIAKLWQSVDLKKGEFETVSWKTDDGTFSLKTPEYACFFLRGLKDIGLPLQTYGELERIAQAMLFTPLDPVTYAWNYSTFGLSNMSEFGIAEGVEKGKKRAQKMNAVPEEFLRLFDDIERFEKNVAEEPRRFALMRYESPSQSLIFEGNGDGFPTDNWFDKANHTPKGLGKVCEPWIASILSRDPNMKNLEKTVWSELRNTLVFAGWKPGENVDESLKKLKGKAKKLIAEGGVSKSAVQIRSGRGEKSGDGDGHETVASSPFLR